MSNIQEQIRQVENKIFDLRISLRIEEGILKRLKALETPEEPLLPLPDNVPTSTPVPQPDAQDGTLVANVKAILSENGGSMRIKEIREKLEAKGVTSNAKSGLGASIANALFRGRNDQFQKVRRGMYRLRN